MLTHTHTFTYSYLQMYTISPINTFTVFQEETMDLEGAHLTDKQLEPGTRDTQRHQVKEKT